ncbi:MAG: oligosaccharide flippase family protein [Tunicatimonas sp.]
MNSALKNILSLFSANILVKGLGIFSVMILIRFLTKEELALLPNYAVVTGLALTISSFGLLPTLIREIPFLLQEKQFDQARSMVITSLWVILPILVVVSIVSYAYSEELATYLLGTEAYALHFKIMAVSFVFSGVRQFFDYSYWAYDMFKEQSRLLVIEGVIKVVFNIVGVVFFGALGLVVSLALTSLISCLVSIYYFRQTLFVGSYQTVSLKHLLSKSAPFYLEGYLMYFRTQGDQLFVTTFLGAEQLAVYFVAKKLYDILQIFTKPLDKVFTNALAKLQGNLGKFNQQLSEIFTINSFIFVPFIALCTGLTPLFIEVIAGSEYAEAVPASLLLTATLLVYFFYASTFGRAIFLLRPSTSRFKLTVVESVSLAIFSLLLVNKLAVEGIALARLLTVIVTGLYSYFYMKRDVKLNVERKPVLLVLVISAVMTFGLLYTQSYSTNFALVAAALLLALAAFVVAIHYTVSDKYYAFINRLLPVKIADPLRLIQTKFSAKKKV